MNKKLTYIVTVILSVFVGCGLMYMIIYYFPNTIVKTENKVEKVVNVNEEGISSGIDNIYDAVVVVENYKKGKLVGIGSGFIYSGEGYIMTNHHVIDSSDEIKITLTSGESIEAKVLGSDELADIAVLQIDKKYATNIAKIGKSTDSKVGDTVFTIGSPMSSEFSGTVTRGILSGKNRMVSMSSTSGNAFYGQQVVDSWYMSLLQIDASINSGNSGGPLANSNGEVIGITNSKLSNSYMNSASIENMGFAIPIEDALAVANQLEENGKVTRAVLGVSMTTVEAAKATGYDLDDDVTYGAVVADISKGSSADKADLKKGDVIIKINDYKVENYMYLKYYLYRFNVGDTVTLTYIRDGKEKTVDITLKN